MAVLLVLAPAAVTAIPLAVRIAALRSHLAAGARRERMTGAHWAAIRVRCAGVEGSAAQEAVCRLANCGPLEASLVLAGTATR